MKTLKSYFNNPILQHILFWVCVLLYFVFSVNVNMYSGYIEILEFNFMVIFTQIITAYTCIYVLIPKFLNKKKYLLFILLLLVLLYAMFIVYNVFKMYFYDPKYYETYTEIGKIYARKSFEYRISRLNVFLSKIIKFVTPTALLLMVRFYKNQQQFLQLKEQKKTAELLALKNQLNPHFLFNTLNNLYSLALEKSQKTPEVIERLSDILDYILYRCKDKFVPIKKEVELIENYLALEKVRYGKRIDIQFKKDVKNGAKIAPLILLTFIENAFKHGVKQELKQAKINIDLVTEKNEIQFKIENTKPNTKIEAEQEPLGLKNVKKQLELLYPETHNLEIIDIEHQYSVTLILKQQ